jgi:hypothetical protein
VWGKHAVIARLLMRRNTDAGGLHLCSVWYGRSGRPRRIFNQGGITMRINDLPAIMETVLIVAGLALVGDDDLGTRQLGVAMPEI